VNFECGRIGYSPTFSNLHANERFGTRLILNNALGGPKVVTSPRALLSTTIRTTVTLTGPAGKQPKSMGQPPLLRKPTNGIIDVQDDDILALHVQVAEKLGTSMISKSQEETEVVIRQK
jgi:hypothetical protein